MARAKLLVLPLAGIAGMLTVDRQMKPQALSLDFSGVQFGEVLKVAEEGIDLEFARDVALKFAASVSAKIAEQASQPKQKKPRKEKADKAPKAAKEKAAKKPGRKPKGGPIETNPTGISGN